VRGNKREAKALAAMLAEVEERPRSVNWQESQRFAFTTCGTTSRRLLTASVDVRAVAGRLGDRYPSTTLNVYSHFVPESESGSSGCAWAALSRCHARLWEAESDRPLIKSRAGGASATEQKHSREPK
jgi:hypothetical protein